MSSPPLEASLSDIIKTLPAECFEKSPPKAWCSALLNLSFVAVGCASIIFSPWYLLPFCWIFTGTALTGLFILGHDCGHHLIAKRRWINDLVGHLILLPVLYPFHNWRIQHNAHHRYTNKLGGPRWRQIQDILTRKADIAWYPLRPEVWQTIPPKERFVYRLWREKLWWIATLYNWWYECTLKKNTLSKQEQSQVRFSVTVVLCFAIFGGSGLIWLIGLSGLIKVWFIPWLVFHFWLSTFTRIHHGAPDIPWHSGQNWDSAESQLCGTVYCHYPWWVEFLCHDINVHIPHHVSTAIPHYHLRKAQESLRENWGDYLKESHFSWQLFKQMRKLNLHDPITGCHLSFREENTDSKQQISLV